MVWFPVVERELRAASRRRATYRVRVLALLGVIVVFAWIVLVLQRSGVNYGDSTGGTQLFTALAVPAAIFSIMVGVFATSDSISAEKREGTLGLLFLTDLSGYDVIWGKLVASSLNGFYALIAVLPVLGVPILAGGVSILQFVKLAVALVTAVVLSMAIGIMVSTAHRDERQSAFYTILLLGLFSIVPLGPTTAILTTVRPAVAAPLIYWSSIAAMWAVILSALLIASRTVRSSWHERPPAQPPPHWTDPEPRRVEMIDPFSFVSFLRSRWTGARPKRAAVEPFQWLALRGEPKIKLTWFFVLSMIALWVLGFLLNDPGSGSIMLESQTATPTLFVINTFLKIWVAAEASRRFIEDRRANAFELLLSTPLDERQILKGQWMALYAQFGPPLLTLALLEMLLRPTAAISLLADSVALASAGIWAGMISKGRLRAILQSTVLVLTVPWCLAALWSTHVLGPGSFSDLGKQFIRFMAQTNFTLGLLLDGAVILWTRACVRSNFRRLVTERPARSAD